MLCVIELVKGDKFSHEHISPDFLKLNLETDNLSQNHAFLLEINEYKNFFNKNNVGFLNAMLHRISEGR